MRFKKKTTKNVSEFVESKYSVIYALVLNMSDSDIIT